ncbi:beta-hexosaminidase 3 [Tripterygium wilfordii]|uniref:Beta-hexosaminidase n=1 Tax=Tripterygium wilfordii TaxID=458696 RepID=A0A7J7CTM5_TRIWF|nr:beta-hexosaminidase 3-like [Tripterygium wilfordii]KAF5737430.1 beta-hexosaminidase 3 [Tripterygium wilfordii]
MQRFWPCVAVAMVVVVVTAAANKFDQVYDTDVHIWPMPKSVTHGESNQKVYISIDFEFNIDERSKYSDVGGILKDGFNRFLTLVEMGHAMDPSFKPPPSGSKLKGINLVISSPNVELQYGVDESYNLSVPAPGGEPYAQLEAQTVYGALHGFQTFSQLCQFDFDTRLIEIRKVPWSIIDQPRFSYRGLMIDTSRHYLHMETIKKIIDSMAYAKMNVLHWHTVDSQSFPLEIPSYPELWKGAYSLSERYTMADAAKIVSYAQRRGINVMAEIDIPGHSHSWGIGYPNLWPSKDCTEPLDISNEHTFKLINGTISDFRKVFKFRFLHLGGDEVNTSCWTNTPHIRKWLEAKGMNELEAYQHFVLEVQDMAISHGYEVVNWQETFNSFGKKLSKKTVVHNWLEGVASDLVVEAGLRCIVSNVDAWYLGPVETPWQTFYENEPLTNIKNSKLRELVIGGEVCMWGEKVDGSDIEQSVWPRTAAASERLWTPLEKLPKDLNQVIKRLERFRCLLNQRGVAAAPLNGLGRAVPEKPGSCFVQ